MQVVCTLIMRDSIDDAEVGVFTLTGGQRDCHSVLDEIFLNSDLPQRAVASRFFF